MASSAGKDSPLKQSRRHEFFESYFPRQNWPFKDSFINYIVMKPSNEKVYQKLIQSCKYFFIKNSILIVDRLFLIKDSKCIIYLNKERVIIDLTTVLCKFWILDDLTGYQNTPPNAVSSIIPKLFQPNIKVLDLINQNILFKEFLILSSKIENINFQNTVVKSKDGSIIPLEKLVNALPKIKKLKCCLSSTSTIIQNNTVNELLKISHFSNVEKLVLKPLNEAFDIETFFSFIKENKNMVSNLLFSGSISREFKTSLLRIIDEIIGTENHDYKIPMIRCGNIEAFMRLCGDDSRFSQIKSLYDKE